VNEANKERKKKRQQPLRKIENKLLSPPIFFPKNSTTHDVNFIAYERENLGILFAAKKGSKTRWY
jgi:hypothetical protein